MNPDLDQTLLKVEALEVSYHGRCIIQDLWLKVKPGRITGLVGPNGAGKTTLLKAIGGLIRPVTGRIFFQGEDIAALPIWEIVLRGLVYVPEGMRVFPQMSVLENLEVGGYLDRSNISARLKEIFELFPELERKKYTLAGRLSGGEQRLVTLARSLMSGARLLLLDDPFLGLSPRLTSRFHDTCRGLIQRGLTLLMAGQHVARILRGADDAFLMEEGRIALSGPGPDLLEHPHLQDILFDARLP